DAADDLQGFRARRVEAVEGVEDEGRGAAEEPVALEEHRPGARAGGGDRGGRAGGAGAHDQDVGLGERLDHPETLQPASTVRASAVMRRESSPSRKIDARATSTASRRSSASGCLVFMSSRIFGSVWARADIGVRTSAGAMTLTRILWGA